MDGHVAAAREQQRLLRETRSLAAHYIERRNHCVRMARRDDPDTWTYQKLADAVGITPELVAAIIQERG